MAIVDPVDGAKGPVPPHVETLRTSLAELIEESQALRGDVRGAEQARRKASQINIALLGLLSLFVGLLLVVTWQNNQLARQVKETNARMADCTTPGGKCYDEGSRRTAGAISDIVRASVFMSQCARLWPGESGPDYDRKLEQCVADRLAQAARERENPKVGPTANPSASTPA